MMLPDFPLLKREMHRLLELGVQIERPGMSMLSAMFPRRPMREGDRTVLVREGSEQQEVPLKKYEAELRIDLTEVGLLTLGEAYKRYLDTTSRIEVEVATDLEDLVDRTAESMGNVVQLSGRPLPEGILEGVEKMLLLGDPRDVDQLFALPQMRPFLKEVPADALEEAREQMKTGPYQEQTEQLLERKHEEYRVRESRRQLVG
jgi:hypothetical protein